MKIVMPLSDQGSDPTEVAIPWQELTRKGHEIVFVTPEGRSACLDERMLTGAGLGPWRFLRARADARDAHTALVKTGAFQKPQKYSELENMECDAVILPGGHAPGMKTYLESKDLQNFVAKAMKQGTPVAAICHGVVVLARAKDADSGQSVIYDRKVTALPKAMEMSAWLLTGLWLGRYYRTYPTSVEDEVRQALKDKKNFDPGPNSLFRDSPAKLSRGFVVRDKNLVTARWPGDAYSFGEEFSKMLTEWNEAS
ncbi:MAG: type 1 glutamine amidotransferase domain-containing protein [Planctomycetota bacterium]|nr:type 1 glutamine amidotransferase domain-containing protein [Planctomycetota bacterium]